MFDSVAGEYLPDRAVLIADGKVEAVGAGGSIKPPTGATVIDGRGKTLLPGLWDAHRHVGGDNWNLLQNVATGMTNYRSPGSMIEEAHDIHKRRAAGDLLAPDGQISVIVDRKDPLAAQGALTVRSAEEAVAAVRQIKAAGLWVSNSIPRWIRHGLLRPQLRHTGSAFTSTATCPRACARSTPSARATTKSRTSTSS
jgi:hypothetical protein